MPQWQNDYMRGTGMEMYGECLSPAFVGMTFPEAAESVDPRSASSVVFTLYLNQSINQSIRISDITYTPGSAPSKSANAVD